MTREFCDMLRDLREKAGLTQEALARKANLSLGFIHKLENGKVNPSWATVKALAKALGVKCAAFEDDDPFAAPPESSAPKARRGRSRKGE